MQQRRYRPGDVLDDYCPRERRITDHAIVAMIDDNIKQTRCVVCDAEHEYKDGKIPPQRRKKAQAALYTQVLDGLQGPQPARVAAQLDPGDEPDDVEPQVAPAALVSDNGHEGVFADAVEGAEEADAPPVTASPIPHGVHPPEPGAARDEGPWRRQLIRAALPRPEGQPPPQTRPLPEFTIRQPNNNRGQRHGRRRGGSGQGQGNQAGPMRFGRGQGQGHQGNGGGRRRRRGGKKNN